MDSSKDQQIIIAMPYPSGNLRGQLTLKGAVQKYWIRIANKWKATRTIKESIADYEKRILMEADPFKAICEYTADDFEAIINKLSYAGEYSVQTIEHYNHLIRLVIEACVEGGEEMDPSVTTITPQDSELRVIKSGLVKSLSETEEHQLFEWLKSLNAETAEGPEIGVAFMLCIGFRNQECSGLRFQDHYYDEKLRCYMVLMIQTTRGKTRYVKNRGKTSNAHRVVPCVFEELNNLVKRRAEYVKKQLELEDISKLPICSKPGDLSQHCTYDDINQAAKKVFKELGIRGCTWKEIEASFDADEDNTLRQVKVEEKDPTAYILRRNAATRYYGLFLTEQEMQYVMGHKIEHSALERSDFQNPDLMQIIVQKLQNNERT